VPSMSSSTAARLGSERIGPSASTSVAAGDTGLVCRATSPVRTLMQVAPRTYRDRTLRLAVIGTLAGLFSGLFGVGGGSVIVPLLMLWLGYEERAATATSLAAIVFVATFAAGVQGLYGNVHLLDAILLGVPAVVGVLAGTWLAQRLRARTIALLFAGLLVASAVELVLG
jgi:uncharacterized membrane protein YfcA